MTSVFHILRYYNDAFFALIKSCHGEIPRLFVLCYRNIFRDQLRFINQFIKRLSTGRVLMIQIQKMWYQIYVVIVKTFWRFFIGGFLISVIELNNNWYHKLEITDTFTASRMLHSKVQL